MPLFVTWPDIALRLACAFVAGALIGLDRSRHGRAAGLRTSILVCLAACVAMIQMNLLLPLAGKPPTSFITNDLMRLPLGILSGMGFIGAGAIVRRRNFITGITTAATLWLVTVLGLCFGGGQIELGLAGTALALIVLIALKPFEDRLNRDRLGRLKLTLAAAGPNEEDVRAVLLEGGFEISSCGLTTDVDTGRRSLNCELRWRAPTDAGRIPDAVRRLAEAEGVVGVDWRPKAR